MAKRNDRTASEEPVVETEVLEVGGELPDHAYRALADILIEYARRELARGAGSNESTGNGGAT